MGTTALNYKTKTIVTSDGDGVPLFDDSTYVYSLAVEMHESSTEENGWCGASDVTTTNKNGRAFSKTIPTEFKSRWRQGLGKQANLIDASSIYVAVPDGGEILITYLQHEEN